MNKTEKTELICRHVVKRSFIENINAVAEMYNIQLHGDFIPKFYNALLKDEFVSNIILCEQNDGTEIDKAFISYARCSGHFPRPEEIIAIIKIHNKI